MNIIKRFFGYGDLILQSYKIRKADSEEKRETAYKKLTESMGKLHGLPQKVGQLMSMSSQASSQHFKDLENNSNEMPFNKIKDILKKTWGKNIEDVLENISEKANAASLGQVHRATLKDGRDVAIKVQYPNIRDHLETEITTMSWLANIKGNSKIKFDTDIYKNEFLRDLNEELDYRHEANLQTQFSIITSALPEIIVPQVINELSSETVLVSEWQDGKSLDDIALQWSDEDKQQSAMLLMKLFCHSLFETGFLHADPHQGNYRFRKNGENIEIILYDFGSVFQCTQDFRLTLMKLIKASTQLEDVDPYRLMLKLGFDKDLLKPLIPKLPAICSILFEPFESPMKFDHSQWNRVERISDVLQDDRWNFRMSGPPNFIFLIRAFHGILSQLTTLNKIVSWKIPLAPYLQQYQKEIDNLTLPNTQEESKTFDSIAKYLVILVEKNGKKKAEIKLPAKRIDDITDLMEEEVLNKIVQRGIDIDAKVKAIRANGYIPQNIVTLEEEDSTIYVSLE